MLIREEYRVTQKRLAGLNPITWGQQECECGFSVDVPRPYWLLHYVVSGSGTFETGGAKYSVSPSQIFVVHPHRAHRYTADEKNPWHYIWIAFESDIELPHLLDCDVFSAPAAGRIFSDIMTVSKLESGKEEFLAAKLWELISLFLQMQNGTSHRPNPYVSAAKEYISQNFVSDIKISDIAKELNLDRTYFSAIFKKETGISPQQFLIVYRLERAAEMLVNGDGSVASAAYAAGYSDIVNFSRMFKKHFGTSPSRYRESILARESSLFTN
ncbi:MAG: helix-turn-helix domain-containing protein [Ruminococcaceae bacterium]|nr:helix-turn-helix domain-containing protein [Oscillospiraceae bacterium]